MKLTKIGRQYNNNNNFCGLAIIFMCVCVWEHRGESFLINFLCYHLDALCQLIAFNTFKDAMSDTLRWV